MKRFLFIGAVLLLSSCASTANYSIQNCVVEDCEITSIHHHAIY